MNDRLGLLGAHLFRQFLQLDFFHQVFGHLLAHRLLLCGNRLLLQLHADLLGKGLGVFQAHLFDQFLRVQRRHSFDEAHFDGDREFAIAQLFVFMLLRTGCFDGNLVARFRAGQVFAEVVNQDAGHRAFEFARFAWDQHLRIVERFERLLGLIGRGNRHPAGDVIPGLGLIDRLKTTVHFAIPLDLGGDLLIGHLESRLEHFQALQFRQLEIGHHFDFNLEAERTFLGKLDLLQVLDVRLSDHVQLMRFDRMGVPFADQLRADILANFLAEAFFDQPKRHPPLAKTRNRRLVLEGFVAIVDFGADPLGRHLDDQFFTGRAGGLDRHHRFGQIVAVIMAVVMIVIVVVVVGHFL